MSRDPRSSDPEAPAENEGAAQQPSRGRLIVPMLLTAAGIFLIVDSVRGLPYHTSEGQPGPGFLPMWLGGALIGISGLIVFLERRSAQGDSPPPAATAVHWNNAARWKIVKFLGVMAGGILAVQFAGALVGIVLLVIAELWWVEGQALWRSALVAVLISAATYALFEIALGVQLP
ncbi:tripartite tricarboxylate transporter TctB family protein [Actinophytocola sp.]|uniref:tripartite tricarboxylate transporter TctB family protein n=1 Tax=Actinophytocola sp. TaxID=1872138 RepID=UPI003D6AAC84